MTYWPRRVRDYQGATVTTTLSDWLLAQIAEDEAVARRANGGSLESAGWGEPLSRAAICDEQGDHIALHPARALADAKAKRQIVERAIEAQRGADAWTHERLKTDTRSPFPEWARRDAYVETLRDLALPYADRPGYREEWRP